MTRKRNFRKVVSPIVTNLFLIFMCVAFMFPLYYLFICCFKSNEEIFSSPMGLPTSWDFSAFQEGWAGVGQYGFDVFMTNSIVMVVPVVLLTVISATFVAYGFTRFDFPGKGILFSLMLSTMMIPYAVTLIPRYILFNNIGWVDSYKPFIIPAAFGGGAFFIYLLVQFFRGIPRELDEAATIDGCGSLRILLNIIVPLSKPALFSAGLFQFIWTWNDFMGPLIYINSVSKYTLSLGLRMSLDMTTLVQWDKIIAMCLVSILPPTILFFSAQKYFVEGIATTGLKN